MEDESRLSDQSDSRIQCEPFPPGDGAVDVRDDDFVVPVPQVDGSLAATRALVLSGDAEHHVVWAFF